MQSVHYGQGLNGDSDHIGSGWRHCSGKAWKTTAPGANNTKRVQKRSLILGRIFSTKQIAWHFLAFIVISCVWVAVAGFFVPSGPHNIDTVVLQGGIPMMAFFFVNKIIFPKGEAKKTMRAK